MNFSQLTSAPGIEWFPSLSPDGRWVVYAGEGSGNRDIYLQSVTGQTPINLTSDSSADDNQPVFSPDGERIAFRSSREGGGIFVMGRTGELGEVRDGHASRRDRDPRVTKGRGSMSDRTEDALAELLMALKARGTIQRRVLDGLDAGGSRHPERMTLPHMRPGTDRATLLANSLALMKAGYPKAEAMGGRAECRRVPAAAASDRETLSARTAPARDREAGRRRVDPGLRCP